MWQRVGGVDINRVPSADSTSGTGSFAYVQSNQQADTDVAQLMTGSFVYNPNTCHRIRFRHSISSGLGGALRLWLLTDSGMKLRELWSSDIETNGWAATVSVGFRYHDRFSLMFEAKRTATTGGRNYAIDDISIPVTDCGTVPLYPASATSSATENNDGTRTEISGTAGVVESPNYPQLYPSDFSHTWTITVPEGSTVQLLVTDLKTELDTDMLTATDVDSGTTIFALSGTPSEISAEYQSSGNEVTLTFSSDTDTNLQGWRVEWTRVDPVTTTFATTPASYGYMICSFNTDSECMTHMEIMNDTDYQWMWVMGQSPNYPESGPLEDFTPGLQSSGYLLMDSSANVNDELGSFMVGPIFRHYGWHKLQFAYHANGDNLGSLTASLMLPEDSGRRKRQTESGERVLWTSDLTPNTEWQTVSETFYQEGEYYIMVTAKRTRNSEGLFRGGDFAIDDLSVTEADVIPTTQTPDLVNGGTSTLTTDTGSIEFYPQTENTQDFSHVWDITTSPDTAIALYIEDFLTEACCDVLTLWTRLLMKYY